MIHGVYGNTEYTNGDAQKLYRQIKGKAKFITWIGDFPHGVREFYEYTDKNGEYTMYQFLFDDYTNKVIVGWSRHDTKWYGEFKLPGSIYKDIHGKSNRQRRSKKASPFGL